MDRSDVISLVSVTRTQDAYGVWRESPKEREVFCKVDSVTRAEYFEGGRNGLKPEYRITMFFGDYDGEQTILFNDKAYGVYRTYHASTDVIELYVERKGGVNGKDDDREAPVGHTEDP